MTSRRVGDPNCQHTVLPSNYYITFLSVVSHVPPLTGISLHWTLQQCDSIETFPICIVKFCNECLICAGEGVGGKIGPYGGSILLFILHAMSYMLRHWTMEAFELIERPNSVQCVNSLTVKVEYN